MEERHADKLEVFWDLYKEIYFALIDSDRNATDGAVLAARARQYTLAALVERTRYADGLAQLETLDKTKL